MPEDYRILDGNEAAATVAYEASEVIAIYPITPASPMGELSDAWSQQGRRNLFGDVPRVNEMQSEGGAAGAVHGALLGGSLATTFTASQGLLLMLPNMFKIAGELTPSVIHVAARSVATHALSIFGDHSDVMAARTTGWAMLCASSVQEAHDFSLVAHGATLETRVPFLHFFDGFRTSHELNRIKMLAEDDLRALVNPHRVLEHRQRGLDPERPTLRGTAQNPDVFFQAREACNPFHDSIPGVVQDLMNRLADRVGRSYHLFDYVGASDAEHVVVIMGSGAGAAEEAVRAMNERGEKVGLVKVRLYRPFDTRAFVQALPETVQRVTVLDRTKEPGAVGEPLYQDVVAALAEHGRRLDVRGGRYGLSSKEFTPSMVAAVFRNTDRRHFTVGINDDLTHLSLDWNPDEIPEPSDVQCAVFYGLGSDGTVGANKNSAKIIGEHTGQNVQAYFVYDSKKSGSTTVSHLRTSPREIGASYLIQKAAFVACHQFALLDRMEVLDRAAPGATFLLNSPYGPDEVWDRLPYEVQEQIVSNRLRLYVIDAESISRELGLGNRINTIMQTCFFALTGILERDEAIAAIKTSIAKTYGKRGESVVRKNCEAVDASIAALHEVQTPSEVTSNRPRPPVVPDAAPDFVQRVTGLMLAGRGDEIPVSAMPVDGSFPIGTAHYEKRSIAHDIPIWDPELCIDCGLCALVCPHAAIRMKVFDEAAVAGAPSHYKTKPWGKNGDGRLMTIQVAPDDCTGCTICVDTCPARSKEIAKHKAIDMELKDPHLEREREAFDFFLTIPEADRTEIDTSTVKGTQLLQPLFEYSGACAGCGETPYVKLISQLFGDRMLLANATGCSSIYGGNLPTTPWAANGDGRGPAWANSLFEDNAEFGLGMRLALDAKRATARRLLHTLEDDLEGFPIQTILGAPQITEREIAKQRDRVAHLRERLKTIDKPEAIELASRADVLVRRSVWIVGGDGWAYDIGYGGLDHVLASCSDVNILVLDTEVYSNTGGQASKATPLGAIAKFAAGGKPTGKKDLGLAAMAHSHVYVAQIAIGANPKQTIAALREAEAYPGTSLVIAYSHCIAHGIDMSQGLRHQKDAVKTAYWPLYRFDPRQGGLKLDSRNPTAKFKSFAEQEGRFAMLRRAHPARAQILFDQAQEEIDARWQHYVQLAQEKDA